MKIKKRYRDRKMSALPELGADRFTKEAKRREDEFKKEQTVKPWIISDKTKADFKIFVKDRCSKNSNNPLIQKLKIVAYTSLSPSHHNTESQLTAITSWHDLGMDVYSLNSPEESQSLKKIYPDWVKFIPSTQTTKHIFGKPYMMITAMINHFSENKSGDILTLINSDIILHPSENLLSRVKSISDSGVCISSRDDFKIEHGDSSKYVHGFDVFFINKKHAHIFPPAIYSMGQTWWDYWVPFTVLKNKIPLFRIEEAFAFHKEHPKQYNEADWHRMTQYFKFEHDFTEKSSQVINDSIWKDICNNSIII